ncbi:NnrU family protein [Rhodanobacter sp. 115]|nr:NnrU family protein [Rhodanobacter sp. 115]
MSMLILGLVIFLGMHSVRIFVPDWREKQVARLGVLPWKGLYATVSIIGFVVLIWGFGLARQHPALLYIPPMWLRHLNALFTLVAFVLLAAAYVPPQPDQGQTGSPDAAGGQGVGSRPPAGHRHAARRGAVRRAAGMGHRAVRRIAPTRSPHRHDLSRRHPARGCDDRADRRGGLGDIRILVAPGADRREPDGLRFRPPTLLDIANNGTALPLVFCFGHQTARFQGCQLPQPRFGGWARAGSSRQAPHQSHDQHDDRHRHGQHDNQNQQVPDAVKSHVQ